MTKIRSTFGEVDTTLHTKYNKREQQKQWKWLRLRFGAKSRMLRRETEKKEIFLYVKVGR